MDFKHCLILLLVFFNVLESEGQVGINTVDPHPSSLLELHSTTTGFLKTRLSTTQRLAIVNPAIGLEVYDTTTQSTWYYNGSEWVQQGGKNIYDSNGDVSPTSITDRTVDFSNGGSLNIDKNTFFINTTANRVAIGTNTTVGLFTMSNSVNNSTNDNVFLRSFTNSNTVPTLSIGKATGNEINPESTLAGQVLGAINFDYHNGTNFSGNGGSRIVSTYRGDGATNLSDIELFTSGNNRRMAIDQNGDVSINDLAGGNGNRMVVANLNGTLSKSNLYLNTAVFTTGLVPANANVTIPIQVGDNFGDAYQLLIDSGNACNQTFYDEFLVVGGAFNNYGYIIKNKMAVCNPSSDSNVVQNTDNQITITRNNMFVCADGGGITALDYRLTIEDDGEVQIRNLGNVPRIYNLRFIQLR